MAYGKKNFSASLHMAHVVQIHSPSKHLSSICFWKSIPSSALKWPSHGPHSFISSKMEAPHFALKC